MSLYWWTTARVLNSGFLAAYSMYGWGRWIIRGNPQSEELKLELENNIRLKKIEEQLQQFWAVQNGLVVSDPTAIEGVIIINANGDEEELLSKTNTT